MLGLKCTARGPRQPQGRGREGDTYLRYIVHNYENLPERLIFTQASPACRNCKHQHEAFENRLKMLSSNVRTMGMGGYEPGTCEGTAFFPMYRLHDIYALVYGTFCPNEEYWAFMEGQFYVDKQTILSNPLSLYQYLLKELNAPPMDWISNDINFIQNDEIRHRIASFKDINYFSFEIERAWAILWRCMKQDAEPCYQA